MGWAKDENPNSLWSTARCDFCEETMLRWHYFTPPRGWRLKKGIAIWGVGKRKILPLGCYKVCKEHKKDETRDD